MILCKTNRICGGAAYVRVFFTAAEYNPFHNGHTYHIEKTLRSGATHFVAVMSPNFVQRGEPAYFDKYLRAEAAVRGGVDLVLELPLIYALSSAERFASGAVEIALATGICDGFTFGCETPDLELLTQAALIMNQDDFQDKIREERRNGKSYPTACMRVCGERFHDVFSASNNLLAVEYIRALLKKGFKGEILPVERFGSAHDSDITDKGITSAMNIRKMFLRGEDYSDYIPVNCVETYRDALSKGLYPENFENAVVSLLRSVPKSAFERLPDAKGGFADRLYRAVYNGSTLEEIFEAAKTKRFTHASVRRAVYSIILSVDRDAIEQGVQYLRPLAFRNETAEGLFSEISKKSILPLLSRHNMIYGFDETAVKMYNMENHAVDLYNSFLKSPRPCGTDRTDRTVIL